MLFVLYGILLLAGMYLVGIAFSVAGLEALVFIIGLLLIVAAVAVPMTAGAFENRR